MSGIDDWAWSPDNPANAEPVALPLYTPEELTKIDAIMAALEAEYDFKWADQELTLMEARSFFESADWHQSEGRERDAKLCKEDAHRWERHLDDFEPGASDAESRRRIQAMVQDEIETLEAAFAALFEPIDWEAFNG